MCNVCARANNWSAESRGTSRTPVSNSRRLLWYPTGSSQLRMCLLLSTESHFTNISIMWLPPCRRPCFWGRETLVVEKRYGKTLIIVYGIALQVSVLYSGDLKCCPSLLSVVRVHRVALELCGGSQSQEFVIILG